MSMSNEERKWRIATLRESIATLNRQLWDLKKGCDHSQVIQVGEGVDCATCGKDLGWWCPESPNHQCDYHQDDGSYDWDCCRHCGQPEERK